MGKKILSTISIMIISVLMLASCQSSITFDKSGYKSSNGGYVVETNDYVYFINGVETYSTTYETGKVTKGALMRTKTENLADLENTSSSDYETVVSKLIVSADYNAGFSIFGDYVYYAVPSTNKDKTGAVQSSVLNFFRTKLDGSSTSKNLVSGEHGNSTTYRYTEVDGTVYLIVHDGELTIYNAETAKKVYTSEETISQLIIDSNNGSNNLYYTTNPINEDLYDPEDESATASKYHFLRKVTIGKDVTDEVVLKGTGSFTVGVDSSKPQLGFTGATFNLIKLVDGVLYFSITSLDTTVAGTKYVAVNETDLTADSDATLAKVESDDSAINYGDPSATSIFGASSLYLSKNQIIYLDTTLGLISYDYTKKNDTASTSYGKTFVYHSKELVTSTISTYEDGYLYYYTAEGVYYSLNLTEILDGKDADQMRINAVPANTAWYKPEVITVNDEQIIILAYTDTNFSTYLYTINLTDLAQAVTTAKADDDAEALDEDKTHLSDLYLNEFTSENLIAVTKTLLGVKSKDDKSTYDEMLEDLIEDEEEDESSES